jgi:uncharacterized protein (TIGR03437 family)
MGQAGYAQNNVTIVSAGNWGPIVAPNSLAAAFGSNLSTQTYGALVQPLPSQLDGAGITISDSNKLSGSAGLLMVSEGQINFLVPATAAVGAGTVTAVTTTGASAIGNILISNVAPAIFSANENGMGAPVGEVFSYPASGSSSYAFTFGGGSNGYSTLPFTLAPSSTQTFLVLFGTGIRNHSPNPVEAIVGGTNVPVTYAGPVTGFAGLDQVNIGPLPQSLAGTGRGDIPVSVIVDGVPANTVTVNIE